MEVSVQAIRQPEPPNNGGDPQLGSDSRRSASNADSESERAIGILDSLGGGDEDAREQAETFEFLRWRLPRDYLSEAYEAGLGEHLTALGPATEDEIERSLALLDSLLEGDEQEQRETGAYIARALAERRVTFGGRGR
jgi:hypothetical protein